MAVRIEKFNTLLNKAIVDINELKELLWGGVPEDEKNASIRMQAWKICLGYLPITKDKRKLAAMKKQAEYYDLVKQHYEKFIQDDIENRVLRQIRVDLPRTKPTFSIFSNPKIQKMMERILFIWSIRHPASSYVQGINDVLTPFVYVFLQSAVDGSCTLDCQDIERMNDETLWAIEADSYWCLSKVLADIQDNYTFGQPGIQRLVAKLKEIVKRIDEPLYNHLKKEGVDFLQFAFRWMNCLLMRELSMCCVLRLWDSYIAEPSEGFSTFHVYVCAVFLVFWSNQLKIMDFQQIMLFMQKFPTAKWGKKEIESLLAEAYVLKSLFHTSPKHLTS